MLQQQNEQMDLAMQQARIELMRHDKWTFFSALILFLRSEVDTDPSVKTASVDGKTIWYNSAFFLSLTKGQRCTLMAHEALHPALKHMFRLMDRDLKTFNDAADHVINNMLLEAGFEPIPDWLCDLRFKGMHTEEVYQILRQESTQQSSSQSGGPAPGQGQPNSIGQDLRSPPKDEVGSSTEDAVSQDIDVMLQQASQIVAAKGLEPGNIPQMIQVYLDSLLKPKLPMAQHLRRFFQTMAKNDYSWRRINRRFKPMLIPGMWSEKLSNIAFAFDMSGSVSDADTKRYVSEMFGVMRMLKPDQLTLVQFDTGIKSVDKIKSVKDMHGIKLVGRGGTNIECVMEWAKKHKPTALVVFTDGEYRHPSFNPGCPILWMIHGHRKDKFHCDFGTTIRFEV